MSVAVAEIYVPLSSKRSRNAKSKGGSRDQYRLQALLSDIQITYIGSQFSTNIEKQISALHKSARTPITNILSLGLGSLSSAERGQTRRLKQFALLLAVRDTLHRISGKIIEVYAQDPTFTRQDEVFLSTHGVRILRTPSGSSLGEAASVITPSTLIYSPFLTLEAYEQLLVRPTQPVQYLIGDDFSALAEKWPKYSAESAQAEKVKKAALGRYRRKAVSGEGFWIETDASFPLAVYTIQNSIKEKAKI